MPQEMTFIVEDARILFPNFSGKERPPYNRAGSRNFAVVLDEKTAREMDKDGWNVKGLDEEEKDPYISVQIGYSRKPPYVVLITSSGDRILDEENIGILDSLDFSNVDLICNASHWSNPQGSGIKAYLKTMFLTLEEDFLMRKYGMTVGTARPSEDIED